MDTLEVDALDPKKELAITHLLASGSVVEAARKSDIGETTLRRWLKEPEFLNQYRACRRQQVEEAIRLLQMASRAAVACLIKHLSDERSSVAISAAKTILQMSLEGVELVDVCERLEVLESSLETMESVRT